MNSAEVKSVCQIRTETGLSCQNCKYNGVCQAYLKVKEGNKNGQKKQGKHRRKTDSSK